MYRSLTTFFSFLWYRYQHLLEASKNWIGSHEELMSRINTALDNPKPFGFITNLPKTTL